MDLYIKLFICPNSERIPRVNPKLNCGLQVIIMCQCRFSLGKKCTILVRNFDSRGGYECGKATGTCEMSVLSSQFYCRYKTALKYSLKN